MKYKNGRWQFLPMKIKLFIWSFVILTLNIIYSNNVNAVGICGNDYSDNYTIYVKNINKSFEQQLLIRVGLTNFTCSNTDCTDMTVNDTDTRKGMTFQILNQTYTSNNPYSERLLLFIAPNISLNNNKSFTVCTNNPTMTPINTTISLFRDEFNGTSLDNRYWDGDMAVVDGFLSHTGGGNVNTTLKFDAVQTYYIETEMIPKRTLSGSVIIFGKGVDINTIYGWGAQDFGLFRMRNSGTGETCGVTEDWIINNPYRMGINVNSSVVGYYRNDTEFCNTTITSGVSSVISGIVQGTPAFNYSWIDVFEMIAHRTDNQIVLGIEAPPVIVNITPIINIVVPSNNSQTHNATPFINFSIGTFSPNLNFTFEIYIDKNNLPTTKINRSENFTSGNFTIFSYTLNNVTEGSLNGTYFIMFNITDNASNNVIVFYTFNLTNNISNYNATNVSITVNSTGVSPPIEVANTLRGHCNSTSKSNEFNNLTSNWTAWWINGSIASWNATTLDNSNITLNANITYMCRVANQFWANGLGSTSLTEFVNSSTITIGDTTSPTITGQAINGNSFTTEQRINVTVNCTDNAVVDYVRVEWNRTGSYVNDTMTLLNSNQYSYTALFAVGNYNITKFYCKDGSNNIANDISNFTFRVTSPSGGGGTPSDGGGGGGGTTTIIKQANTTFDLLTENLGDEYESITVSSNSIKDVKVLIENKGNKTVIVKLKCIESSNISSIKDLCDNVEFQQESFNIIPSTIPLETQIRVRIPEAELFKTFSLIIEGTSPEGGLDDLRMTFIIFPKFTDAFKIIKQLIIGITRFSIGDISIPFPNIISFLFMEGVFLILFVRKEFTGKWIVIGLLTIIALIITTVLSFEVCKLAFAECLNI